MVNRASQFLLVLLAFLHFAPRVGSASQLDFHQHSLSNGLEILCLEDFSCPIVAVQLWYHVGSKDEHPERQGFAHMFEHMMFRGTSLLGPTDHFDLLRRTGGTCNAYTSFDQTVYHEIVPAEQLELALWLEAERMAFLKIDQESFDTERKVVEEERRLGLNRPYGKVPEKLLASVFKTHPYRWTPIGKIPHLRAASVAELREFWNRYYVPNNATLVITGAVKHEEAFELAERYFGWIPRYDDPPRVTVREPLNQESQSITITDDSAPLTIVGVGYRTVPLGHVDQIPLRLLATILGGGNSSRIYRDLVAEKQLAVMALAMGQSLEHEGLFGAGAALPPLGGDAPKVRAAILAQIERLKNDPIPEEEITKAKNQMQRELVLQTLTADSKASALGSAAVLEGDPGSINRRLGEVQKVKAEDLARVARTYLVPEREYQITVERNLLGSLFKGNRSDDEESAAITAAREEFAPPPGRNGLKRPFGLPSKPPVAKPVSTLAPLAVTTHVLPNGLKVILVPNHEVPFVTVLYGLKSGAWTETKPGSASLAAQMLVKGTATRSEAEIARELETHAISLEGSADIDSTSLRMDCLAPHLDRGIELLTDVLTQPAFSEEEFRKLKKQIRASLAITTAQPEYIAERQLRRILFPGHPYSRTAEGEVGEIDALEVGDCQEWWRTFARPEDSVLILAGDIQPQPTIAAVTKALGEWRITAEPVRSALPPIPESQPTQIYLVDRPGASQSQIRAGIPSIARSDAAIPHARVVGGYFGGAFNSRLNEVIRVQKGLTYGARGGYLPQRFGGQFNVSTFSKTETTVETVKTLRDELHRLREVPPTPAELENTKAYLLGSFARERETPQQIANELWLLEQNGLTPDEPQRMLEVISKTAEGDCMRLIADTVDAGRMAIVVVGDAKRLKEPLAELGVVTLIDAKSSATKGQTDGTGPSAAGGSVKAQD